MQGVRSSNLLTSTKSVLLNLLTACSQFFKLAVEWSRPMLSDLQLQQKVGGRYAGRDLGFPFEQILVTSDDVVTGVHSGQSDEI